MQRKNKSVAVAKLVYSNARSATRQRRQRLSESDANMDAQYLNVYVSWWGTAKLALVYRQNFSINHHIVAQVYVHRLKNTKLLTEMEHLRAAVALRKAGSRGRSTSAEKCKRPARELDAHAAAAVVAGDTRFFVVGSAALQPGQADEST
jgi:hypothetical protein